MRGCVVYVQRVFMSVCGKTFLHKRFYTYVCTQKGMFTCGYTLLAARWFQVKTVPISHFRAQSCTAAAPHPALSLCSPCRASPRVRPALPCIKSCTVPAVLPNYCRTTATLLLRDLSRQRPERTEVYAIGLPAGSVMSGDGHGFQIDDAHRVGTGVGHIGGVVVGRHESDRDG